MTPEEAKRLIEDSTFKEALEILEREYVDRIKLNPSNSKESAILLSGVADIETIIL